MFQRVGRYCRRGRGQARNAHGATSAGIEPRTLQRVRHAWIQHEPLRVHRDPLLRDAERIARLQPGAHAMKLRFTSLQYKPKLPSLL